MDRIIAAEENILRFLQALRNPSLDLFSYLISDIPFLIMLWTVIFCVIGVLNRDKIKALLFSLPIVFISYKILVELIFKNLVTRPRPYLVLEDIQYIGPELADFSFPSAHVTVTTALVYLAVFCEGRFLGPGIIFILLMCFSRMYNGVHWPLDTVGGIIFGVFIAWISLRMTKRLLLYLESIKIRQSFRRDKESKEYKIPLHQIEKSSKQTDKEVP
jgi:membrane-associated phospholipid phosphatase